MSKVTKKDETSIRKPPEKPVLVKLVRAKKTASKNNDISTEYSCVMCHQKFQTHILLKQHFQLHAKNSIDIRGRPIEQSTLLKNPRKDVITLNIIPCEFCSEVAPNISKAIQHKFRKHRFEGSNYFCEFCGKLFPIKIALEQHKQTTHSNESVNNLEPTTASNISKEYCNTEKEIGSLTCSFCPVAFLKKDALDFHEKNVHKFGKTLLTPVALPPPSTKVKMNTSSEIVSVYYCHLCGSEYIMKYNLRKHLQAHHTVEERIMVPDDGIIRCKTCESMFYTKKAYTAHAIHHRPGDLYVTSEEQRQKVVGRIDQDFDFRRIPNNMNKYIPRSGQRKKKEISERVELVEIVNRKKLKTKDNGDIDEEPMTPPSLPSSSDEDDGDTRRTNEMV